MGFWNFLRDMFVFDWLFGNHLKGGLPGNHTNYTSNNHECKCGHDYDDYLSPRANRSCTSWDDDHYSSDDYYHDSCDDYAHDIDDFDDDF